jgi:hypothetical protein
VQNAKMSCMEKNRPELAHKGPRPVGLVGLAQPVLVPVRAPFSSVLSLWNPNRVGRPPFAREAI